MSNRRGLSRGDVRRNARLARLREVVRVDHAVLGVDLASAKQVVVVTDHESRVLARRTVRCTPWELGQVLRWALVVAAEAGFAGVTVACEPTGHRWKAFAEVAADAGVGLVCVQPLLVARAREAEDFTRDKSDDKDALLIARLATQLHVYLPEQPDAVWSRLRHLGARRVELVTRASAARQQVRDLLESAWPAALTAAAAPLDSLTWLAAMSVAGCDPARVARLGRARFDRAVATELTRRGGKRLSRRVLTAFHATIADPRGNGPARAGALERAASALADLDHARTERDRVEAQMTGVIDQLGLTDLINTIPGITVIGAAAILAETGDPARFDTARALVKHAGLCPRANSSGAYAGKTTISGRGRPLLRLAAWRAAWAAIRHNRVLAARYHHLTTRTSNPLTDTQARVAVAASLLRQLHAVLTTATPWNPAIAAGQMTTTDHEVTATAA